MIFSSKTMICGFLLLSAWVNLFQFSNQQAHANTKQKQHLQFFVVEAALPGESRCLKNIDPEDRSCFIPVNHEVITITQYSAKKVAENTRGLSLRFGNKEGEKLTQMMNANIGKRIALIVDGKLVLVPVVRDKINAQKLEITLATEVEAKTVKKTLGIL